MHSSSLFSDHRRHSIRLPGYNYSQPGEYFITLCTYKHQYIFGEIIDDETILSPLGIIVQDCWAAIPDHFPVVELGVSVIIPNHVHGIIIISDDDHGDTIIPSNEIAQPCCRARYIVPYNPCPYNRTISKTHRGFNPDHNSYI